MSGPVPGWGQANCVAQRGTEATEAWISHVHVHVHVHVRVSARSRKERNGPSGSAGTPAATAHWDDSERARSLARSCSRARSSAASLAPSAVGATGIANGQAVELDARSRGARAAFAQARRHAAHTQRASSRCPWTTRGCQAGCHRDGVSRKRLHAARTGRRALEEYCMYAACATHSRPHSHQVAPSLINNGGVLICRGASHCCWSRH